MHPTKLLATRWLSGKLVMANPDAVGAAPVPDTPSSPDTPRQSRPSSTGDTGRAQEDTANTTGGRPADPDLREGNRPVPEYTLVSYLGRGQFGVVWKAQDDNGKEVALKFIRYTPAPDGAAVAELERMKNLGHPHLLVMHRYWRLDNWLVVALELAQETLDESRKRGVIALPRLLEYFREAAKGLDYLDEQGLQHRDVKPANLLLVGGGVKVADFGLVKLLATTVATNTNRNISGTPAFAAPEVWQAKTSRKTDQYALAVSWCQMRAGSLPFSGDDLMAIAWAHCHSEPNLSMLPPAERPAVLKALAKKPEDRWPSCRAFVEALAASAIAGTREDGAPTTRREMLVYARRRPKVYAVVSLILTGLLGGGVCLAMLKIGAERPTPSSEFVWSSTPVSNPSTGRSAGTETVADPTAEGKFQDRLTTPTEPVPRSTQPPPVPDAAATQQAVVTRPSSRNEDPSKQKARASEPKPQLAGSEGDREKLPPSTPPQLSLKDGGKAGLYNAAILDLAEGKGNAADIAAKAKLGDVMQAFKPRSKGGLGIGPTPDAIKPDGIEQKLIDLGNSKRRLSESDLIEQSDALARVADATKAISELAVVYADKDGKKNPTKWKKYAGDLTDSAAELAVAARRSDGDAIKKAASKIVKSCIDCHADFRE